jgi:hypothetical protein
MAEILICEFYAEQLAPLYDLHHLAFQGPLRAVYNYLMHPNEKEPSVFLSLLSRKNVMPRLHSDTATFLKLPEGFLAGFLGFDVANSRSFPLALKTTEGKPADLAYLNEALERPVQVIWSRDESYRYAPIEVAIKHNTYPDLSKHLIDASNILFTDSNTEGV